jgi:hypothetical protein
MPKEPGNKEKCPFCEAECIGFSSGWGMSPEGWEAMKKRHDADHTPTTTVEKCTCAEKPFCPIHFDAKKQEKDGLSREQVRENKHRSSFRVSEGWEKKIRNDYKGIISEVQIEATVNYWRDIISNTMGNAYSMGQEDAVEKVFDIIDSINHEGTYLVREEVKEIIHKALTTKQHENTDSL